MAEISTNGSKIQEALKPVDAKDLSAEEQGYFKAKAKQYAAERRDGGNQHSWPMFVPGPDGKLIRTREG